ncbi:MAG: DNA polymerase III subunit delta' [Rhizobiaceae bacterium]|nr:DNA polymerase III subunit delta' [Rhizobiaceae bacterium]
MSFERLAPEQHDTLEGVSEPAESRVLIGHAEAGRLIASAYRAGRLPHALLLVGPGGIGKATFAFHLAGHLLANRDPAAAPDELSPRDPQSALFRQIASGSHPAVLHLTRSYNDKTKKFASTLGVDEIRRVSRFLSMTSHDGSHRIVIVDATDDMTVSAANALLKRLEEPPARTVFLLISHSPGRLLPTIRSRCQLIRMAPLEDGELAAILSAQGFALPAEPVPRGELLARAGGSARRAILLAEFGGQDIIGAFETLTSAERLDVPGAHRLAEIVSARDQEIRFDLLNAHMLDRLAESASQAAVAGQGARAQRLSSLWQELRVAVDEADTYNLDRKQHVLNMLLRLHDTFRM